MEHFECSLRPRKRRAAEAWGDAQRGRTTRARSALQRSAKRSEAQRAGQGLSARGALTVKGSVVPAAAAVSALDVW